MDIKILNPRDGFRESYNARKNSLCHHQDKKEAAMTVLNGHVVVSWEHWSLKYKKILIYDFSMGVVHVILD